MSRPLAIALLIKFDKYSWYFFIAWFAVALVLRVAGSATALSIAYWGVVLILINNLFRLVLVAEQFRETGKPRYQLLAYLMLLVLLGSIGVQFLIR